MKRSAVSFASRLMIAVVVAGALVACEAKVPQPNEGPSDVRVPTLSAQATVYAMVQKMNIEKPADAEQLEAALIEAHRFLTREPEDPDLKQQIEARLKQDIQRISTNEIEYEMLDSEEKDEVAVVMVRLRQKKDGTVLGIEPRYLIKELPKVEQEKAEEDGVRKTLAQEEAERKMREEEAKRKQAELESSEKQPVKRWRLLSTIDSFDAEYLELTEDQRAAYQRIRDRWFNERRRDFE